MHYIQSKILDKLTYTKTVRYSQLKPKNTESNLFSYHLRRLLKDKLIQKNKDGSYELSSHGKAYVDRISHNTLKVREQPKIVTLLMIQNEETEYLLLRRAHQPYIGMVGLPSGKLHMQERINEAAERELSEKVGNIDVELSHRGIAYVEIYENKEFISEVLLHVFTGVSNSKILLQRDSKRAVPFWAKVEDIPVKEQIPGTHELIQLCGSGNFFFKELKYDLATYTGIDLA